PQGPPGEGPPIPLDALFQASTTKGPRSKRSAYNMVDEAVDSGNASEASGTLTGIYANIYVIRKEISYLKRPMGTKENPSRTCKDIFLAYKEFESGKRRGCCSL